MIRSEYCRLPDAEMTIDDLGDNVAGHLKAKNAQFESCGRPDIGVGVLRSTRIIERNKLEHLIENYAKKTIRIKGFAKLDNGKGIAVQTSYDNVAFEIVRDYQGSTELIAMGEGFNLSEFSRNYRELAS